jgi:hypothetical protein
MNTKLLSGSVLTGLSLLSIVVTEWAGHFFFTMFHIARGESLEAVSRFDPGPYGTSPEATQIFVGTRVLLWVALVAGLALLGWGVLAEYRSGDASV